MNMSTYFPREIFLIPEPEFCRFSRHVPPQPFTAHGREQEEESLSSLFYKTATQIFFRLMQQIDADNIFQIAS